jgi:hypothetical protein
VSVAEFVIAPGRFDPVASHATAEYVIRCTVCSWSHVTHFPMQGEWVFATLPEVLAHRLDHLEGRVG